MSRCPIWGTEAKVWNDGSDSDCVDSARAGGTYRVSRTAKTKLENFSPADKAKLTTWIIDQRRSGDENPLVKDTVIQVVMARRQMRPSEQKRRFFLFFLSREFRISDQFFYDVGSRGEYLANNQVLAAWTGCHDDNEILTLISILREEGFLLAKSGVLELTFKGFQALEDLESGTQPSTTAFVAMWFDDETQEAYKQGIYLAIEETGYLPLRIDRKEHANKIDDEIVAEIRRSRFVVADFTCGLVGSVPNQTAVSRGGVYYEAGFAQGLGIPVIWCCRKDCLQHVHFDTRQFNYIDWETPEELRTRLTNRIRAVIA